MKSSQLNTFTFGNNLAVGLINPDPPIRVYEHPQAFMFLNFTKSVQHGFIWPSIPISLLAHTKDYCILGGDMRLKILIY
jgi:hypothetical protein